jgi:hypothetical protein
MLSLGRIVQIKDHEILVSLPGRTLGCVPVTSISRPYTKALERLAASGGSDDVSDSVLVFKYLLNLGSQL